MPFLRLKSLEQKGRVFLLDGLAEEKTFVIGRDPNAEIPILDSGASRRHAEVYRVGEMYFIRDLRSKNGTFLNDEQIKEELLQVGDKIKIGTAVFIYEESLEEQARIVMDDIEFAGPEAESKFTETMAFRLRSSERNGIETLGEMKAVSDTNYKIVREAQRDFAGKLHHLFDLARIFEKDVSPETIIQETLMHIAQSVEAECAIFFVKTEDARLIPRGVYKKKEEDVPKVSRSIIRQAVQSGKAILTTDAGLDSRFNQSKSIIAQGIKSVMCVPLTAREKQTGILYLTSSSESGPFSDVDLEFASIVGLQAGIALDTLQAKEAVRKKFLQSLSVLISLTEERDPKLHGHSVRVTNYAAAIANQLKLSYLDRYFLQSAAILHDVGKLTFFASPPRNEDEERKFYLEHPHRGVEVIKQVESTHTIQPGILQHHEYIDGSGFPNGLKGDEISLQAKIICVANEFDKFSFEPGKVPTQQDSQHALQELCKLSGKKLDVAVVDALVIAHKGGSLFREVPLFQDIYQAPK
ncbi:MAG: FHA domain-containing protein [Planctomycetes bacterium]|nr:FHA domain-containing protein [Planctomycetota bacterium]